MNKSLFTRWPKLGDSTLYLDVIIVESQEFSLRKQGDVSQHMQKYCEEHAMSMVDRKVYMYEKITIGKLLHERRGEVILIEGDPGAGKTTLTLQICKQWAKGELLPEDFLIWIPLRYYKSVGNLDHLFNELGYPRLMEYAQQTNGKDLVFLLDGWDELPNQLQVSSIFHDIIFSKNMTFSFSTIVVTSRPICCCDIARAVEETESHYQILGFSPQNSIKYIKNYFKDDELSAKSLLDFVKVHENLCPHFYIPITLAILCFVYSHSHGQVPETLSKLYEHFVVLYVRCNVSNAHSQDIKHFYSLSDVPEKLKPLFSKLCKIAFSLLKEKKLVFYKEELEIIKQDVKDFDQEQFDGFGLLHIDHYTTILATVEKSYSFIHRAVQELLAAFYVMDTDSISDTLDGYFYEDSYFMNMFPFLFGLVSKELLKPLAGKLIQIFSKSNRNDKLLSSILYCLFEAHDETLCREFGKVFSEKRDIKLFLHTLLECHYACYFLSVCDIHKLNVYLFHILISDLCFEIMDKYFSKTSPDLASFRCSINTVSHKGIERFAKVLNTQCNLRALQLDFNKCNPGSIAILCNNICKYNLHITYLNLPEAKLNQNDVESIGYLLATCPCLEIFHMDYCSPSEGVCLDFSLLFCKTLYQTKSLHKLLLSDWSLSQADSKVFGDIISQNCSLKELCINVATADCLDPILNGLSSNTSIITFKASCNQVTTLDCLGWSLEKCLTFNHSLRITDFTNNYRKRPYVFKYISWSPTQVSSICTGLCANTTVVTLDISGCYIDTDACHAVCGVLSQNTTLQHLFLNPVHLEKQQAVTMIDSCRANATLELLSLVQWPPKTWSGDDQGKDPFQYSCDQEITLVLQQMRKLQRLLNIYW